MTRSSRFAFVAVVLAVTAVFVRLGVWQLDRLEERRAENRRARERLRRPPLALGLPAVGAGRPDDAPDGAAVISLRTDSMDRRRVVLRGRFDYGREVVLAPRSFGGTPGVYLLTPLVVGDSAAVPVLRGSMPAPDGFHAALGKARPAWARGAGAGTGVAAAGAGSTTPSAAGAAPAVGAAGGGSTTGPAVTVRGVALLPPDVEPVERLDTLRAAGGAHPVLPRLDLERVDALLPWRIPGWYVRADSTTEVIPAAEGIRVPVAVAPPALDDGPHLMYAVQWFAFAAIGLVGGGFFLALRTREDDQPAGDGSGDGGLTEGGGDDGAAEAAPGA